jgi:YHS domain-containing protein
MKTTTGAKAGILVAALSLFGAGAALAQDHGHGKHEHEGHGAKDAKTVDLWVCEGDATTGLSWEAACPLDGKPAVKKTVERSTLTDLHNAKCPIMGGDTKGDVFAVYKGKVVHFCCPGCKDKFFVDPAGYVANLEKGAKAGLGTHEHGM